MLISQLLIEDRTISVIWSDGSFRSGLSEKEVIREISQSGTLVCHVSQVMNYDRLVLLDRLVTMTQAEIERSQEEPDRCRLFFPKGWDKEFIKTEKKLGKRVKRKIDLVDKPKRKRVIRNGKRIYVARGMIYMDSGIALNRLIHMKRTKEPKGYKGYISSTFKSGSMEGQVKKLYADYCHYGNVEPVLKKISGFVDYVYSEREKYQDLLQKFESESNDPLNDTFILASGVSDVLYWKFFALMGVGDMVKKVNSLNL